MNAIEVLSATEPVTLTSDLACEIEDLLDRALVAHYTGWARNNDGNGVRHAFAFAFDDGVLNALSGRGLVRVERREIGSPLVRLTEAGHEVINDIEGTPAFDNLLTVSLIQRAMEAKAPGEWRGCDFYLRPNSLSAQIVNMATKAGYLFRLSHTQVSWTDEGLARAKRELPA